MHFFRLSETGNAVLTLDANGNTLESSQAASPMTFGYNARNRLTQVTQGDSVLATYTYNAMGERIAKARDNTTQRYVYDEGHQLLGEYGDSARDYIYLDNLPIAVIDASTNDAARSIAYLVADQLNAPRAAVDAQGETIWSWPLANNPFGEEAPTSNGYVLNLRFPGQYYDAETGLFYNVQRDFDPATGRYRQSDPMGLAAGYSTYGYVGGDPLDYTDPLGLAPHNYTVTDFICYAAQSGCTPQNVYNQLLRYPAPFSNGNPVSTGDVSYIPGLGHVSHIVDPTHCSVTNITEPDHELYPGQVTRSVVQGSDGSISVVTTGTGGMGLSRL